jgi:hypothetical protein
MTERLEAWLRSCVYLGAAVVVITEALGACGLIRRLPLAVAWLAAAVLWLRLLRPSLRIGRPGWLDGVLLGAVALLVLLVGLTALLSPPNSADAMSYHLPRVVYWSQAGSVAFFPTPYYNQVMMPPLAEYFMLHTYVLSGGDRFVNLVQWFGMAGSLLAVSLVAGALGAGTRGRVLAVVFCATIPNGILQASGAKNDYLLALWLAAMTWFALRGDRLHTGLSLALALLTKGTAYLLAPPILLLVLGRRLLAYAPAAVLCVLALNGPQYWRNVRLSGSPLGFDSAQADGVFRWRNESWGWRPTASNLLRNVAVHLGGRSPRWNEGVYRAVVRAHQWMGTGVSDPATTWRWEAFRPPAPSNHEADAPNRWHLLLLILTIPALLRARGPSLRYAAGLALGFLLFCFYLKWMPWMTRLHLPLFVLASPPAGLAGERLRSTALQGLLCLFLLNNARPYVFENWTRPLAGAAAVWRTPRRDNYFRDMAQWDNRESYLRMVEWLHRSRCRRIGIDVTRYQLEYPLQALLLERDPQFRFVHTGVPGAAADPAPCAVVCFHCESEPDRLAEYQTMGDPATAGRFRMFVSPRHGPQERPMM